MTGAPVQQLVALFVGRRYGSLGPPQTRNFATCLVVDFARARKRLRAAAATTREPRDPSARLARALVWQRQLDAGEVAARAEIARREGISRARVTQIMRALTKRQRHATLSA